jgi:predicted ABC-type ATPase
MAAKRVRLFGGPNGSGKSTLINTIQHYCNLGIYINADDIEQALKQTQKFNFKKLKVNTSNFLTYLKNSTLIQKSTTFQVQDISIISENEIAINNQPDGYLAAAIADYIRTELLKNNQSFSFETVMSDISKVALLEKAKTQGFKTYLYFICTDSFLLNIERIKNRIAEGGHAVPEDKIKSRYFRSLDNLLPVLKIVDRAYLFDNSNKLQLIAESNSKKEITIKNKFIPNWYINSIAKKISN